MSLEGKLVLLDFDGTLLPENIFPSQADALVSAAAAVFGPVDPGSVDWVGRTDLQIARALALTAGASAEDFDYYRNRFYAHFCRAFREACPDQVLVRQGWHEVLIELQRQRAVPTLVTGNVLDVALVKLERSRLMPLLSLGFGGYGSDSEDRSRLLMIAMERAAVTEAIVVGDTPRDVEAAHAADLPCVALVTPRHRDDLNEAEYHADDPWEVFSAIHDWATS